MNERANELIKSIPDLKYDASTGLFETDRRALYDLVEKTVRECMTIAQMYDGCKLSGAGTVIANRIDAHFEVNGE